MASNEMRKKRSLPAWMVTMKEQNKKVKVDSVESEGSAQDNQSIVDTQGKKKTFVVSSDDMPDGNLGNGASVNATRNNETASVNSSEKNNDSALNAGDIIAQSMPLLKYTGSITYSYHASDCACICEDILSSISSGNKKTVVGFDMEWPVTFRGGTSDKTALIQMCLSETSCYLFHVSAMSSFPKPLKTLILHPQLILAGVNIETDLWKLERDYGVRVKPMMDRGSVVDVGKLANVKLKSSERWSLDGLCRNVLKYRLDKDAEVRCGNWDEVPLSKSQKLYAATDAYAGLLLYNQLTISGDNDR